MKDMTTTAHATQRMTSNPLLSPVLYWRVNAIALTAVALLGVVMALISGGGEQSTKDQILAFDSHHFLGLTWTHTIVHFALAAAAFVFGFANLPGNVTKTFAIVFGFVYAGLGVLGFLFSNPLGGALALNLGTSLNIVHLLLGGWALAAGFTARY